MKEKKLQVFVSSTFTDLIEERQAAVEAILSSGNIPAGMELFSAADETQMTIIKRWIDESDVYMLILGGRYGSIESKSRKSYTQLEYEYAVENSKPLFAVILNENFIDEKVKSSGKSVLENENNKELKEFKNLVESKMVKFCDDKKDIKLAIHETLSEFAYRKELVGWIRGDNAINSSLLAEEIARLTKENDELRKSKNSVNQQEPLYNSLTFQEFKSLLLKDNVVNDELNYDGNLYGYLKHFGNAIAAKNYRVLNKHRHNASKLVGYKIIDRNFDDGFHTTYSLTEEGHRFFLRSLLDEEI